MARIKRHLRDLERNLRDEDGSVSVGVLFLLMAVMILGTLGVDRLFAQGTPVQPSITVTTPITGQKSVIDKNKRRLELGGWASLFYDANGKGDHIDTPYKVNFTIKGGPPNPFITYKLTGLTSGDSGYIRNSSGGGGGNGKQRAPGVYYISVVALKSNKGKAFGISIEVKTTIKGKTLFENYNTPKGQVLTPEPVGGTGTGNRCTVTNCDNPDAGPTNTHWRGTQHVNPGIPPGSTNRIDLPMRRKPYTAATGSRGSQLSAYSSHTLRTVLRSGRSSRGGRR